MLLWSERTSMSMGCASDKRSPVDTTKHTVYEEDCQPFTCSRRQNVGQLRKAKSRSELPLTGSFNLLTDWAAFPNTARCARGGT